MIFDLEEYDQAWKNYVESVEEVVASFSGQPVNQVVMHNLFSALESLQRQSEQSGYNFPRAGFKIDRTTGHLTLLVRPHSTTFAPSSVVNNKKEI